MSDHGCRPGTAYHEAGHAVIRHSLGRSFKSVSVMEDEHSLGRVAWAPVADWFRPDIEIDGRTRRRVEDDIMTGIAGPLAEERVTGVFDDVGAEGDMRGIISLASYTSRGEPDEAAAFIEWLRCRTVNLLDDPFCWAGIESLAGCSSCRS